MMKRILLSFAVLLCIAACQKYDDTLIKQDIKDLQEQVASLKAWCETSQDAVNAVAALQDAVANLNGVSSVEMFSDRNGEGYRIVLDDGTEITVYNVSAFASGSFSYLGKMKITESSIEFILTDGTSVRLPRLDATIRFGTYEKLLVEEKDTIYLILPALYTKDDFAAIKAEIASDDGVSTSVATKAEDASGEWKVKVYKPEFGEDGLVSGDPFVVIVDTPDYASDAILTVTVVDNAGASHTTSTTIYTPGCSPEVPDEPIEDQGGKIIGEKAVLYGNVQEGFGEILLKRFFSVSASYVSSTQVCLVTDEALKSGSLKKEDYLDIYDCYNRGGVIFFVTPTHAGFNDIFQPKMAEALNSQSILKFNMKIDDQTPDLTTTNRLFSQIQLPEDDEKVWSGLGVSKKDILYCEDVDGDGQSGEAKATPYQIGLRADAAAGWINKCMSAQAGKSFADDVEKAKISETFLHDINYYMPASSVQFNNETFSECPFTDLRSKKEAFIETISYVAAHDTYKHTDYYLITQDAEFRSNMIDPAPSISKHGNWWTKTCDVGMWLFGKYGELGSAQVMYYHHFLSWETKMKIQMSGKSILIRSSHPESANSTTTTTTTVTNGTMESETNGLTVGGSIGGSKGGGFSGMISGSYSHSWTTGTTHQVGVGTTRSKQDISIAKSVNGAEAKWTYTGLPGGWYLSSDNYYCWQAGDLQVSSMSQTNSLFVSIDNVTSGTAKLVIDNTWKYRTGGYFYGFKDINGNAISTDIYPVGVKKTFQQVDATASSHQEIGLPMPFRFTQEWSLNCTSYGDTKVDYRGALWNYVENNMLSGKSIFFLADNTENGTTSAQELMNMFMTHFASVEEHLKATYDAKGKFTFKLKRTNGAASQEITAEYEIQ